jgi:hypothetical protein
MKRFKDRMTFMVASSELLNIRLALFLAELFWGLSLISPGETFSSQGYDWLNFLMPEFCWGVLFLIVASIQLFILLCHSFHSFFSIVFAGFNAILWWFVVIGIFASVYTPPAGASGNVALAFAASWVFVRSGVVLSLRRKDE